MAPALNEPLNQAQLPLSPASASSSPRPGILSSSGADLVQKLPSQQQQPQQPPTHAITNRYNKINQQAAAAANNSSSSSSNTNGGNSAKSSSTSSSNTFQLAFIQQIASNTATNGPAATGPPNVQRHMDRKDSPSSSRTVKSSSASSSTSSSLQQQPQQQQPAAARPNSAAALASHHQHLGNSFTTNAAASPSSSASVAHLDQHILLHDHFGQPHTEHHNDDEDDEDALKSDVQELADLDLHLDEETTNALINHHSLCESLAAGSEHQQQQHQQHDQQNNHHNQHHYQPQQQQLAADGSLVVADTSPSHNNNTMGLQKDYLKDNPEMEQMLGELANTSDLELLQVFKSLTPSNTDHLCDLGSGLGGLFSDVDVMNIGLDEVSTPVKEPDTADLRNEIKKRQSQMQRKCDFLLRRLRKLQTRTMAEHVDEEVQSLFAYTQALLKRRDGGAGGGSGGGAGDFGGVGGFLLHGASATFDDYHDPLLDEGDNPTRVMLLLQRLDATADAHQKQLPACAASAQQQGASVSQQPPHHHQHHQPLQQPRKSKDPAHGTAAAAASHSSGGAAGTVSAASLSTAVAATMPRVIPCFEPAFSSQLALTAGHLHTEMKLIGSALDSDATVSSSGGDSGDEFSAYSKQQQQQHLYQQQQSNPTNATAGKEIPNM